jgi:hypothetical protein
LKLCTPQGCYLPGQAFTCRWSVARVDWNQIEVMECSVLWYTEGKGDEDLAVVHFERHDGSDILAAQGKGKFNIQLPHSPLSYDGRLLRIRWCTRMRLFLTDGREIVAQQPFFLGAITNEV